eukprot:scpid83097/ scgid8811/ 
MLVACNTKKKEEVFARGKNHDAAAVAVESGARKLASALSLALETDMVQVLTRGALHAVDVVVTQYGRWWSRALPPSPPNLNGFGAVLGGCDDEDEDAETADDVGAGLPPPMAAMLDFERRSES